jgi:hypothetical protein
MLVEFVPRSVDDPAKLVLRHLPSLKGKAFVIRRVADARACLTSASYQRRGDGKGSF